MAFRRRRSFRYSPMRRRRTFRIRRRRRMARPIRIGFRR